MNSDDRTADITNLPEIVMAPNHTTIYRNGRFQPVVPGPPLPADFNTWLAAARRLGYYRMCSTPTDIIWAWPQPPRERFQMMGNRIPPRGDHTELAEATLARSRARLIDRCRQIDADHTPEVTDSGPGQTVCARCGITVRSDLIHHGFDSLYDREEAS